MEWQLQLKPFTGASGMKCEVIQITDFMLHTSKMRSTQHPAQRVREALKTKTPGRIYMSSNGKPLEEVGVLDVLSKDPKFIAMVQEKNRNGIKVLLGLPKSGVPMFAGKDTQEFIESKKGKRILRRINKQKTMT